MAAAADCYTVFIWVTTQNYHRFGQNQKHKNQSVNTAFLIYLKITCFTECSDSVIIKNIVKFPLLQCHEIAIT